MSTHGSRAGSPAGTEYIVAASHDGTEHAEGSLRGSASSGSGSLLDVTQQEFQGVIDRFHDIDDGTDLSNPDLGRQECTLAVIRRIQKKSDVLERMTLDPGDRNGSNPFSLPYPDDHHLLGSFIASHYDVDKEGT
jgi:hypothetical protein